MATKANKKRLKKERSKAAEAVCSTLLTMMAFGGLDVPIEDREFLAPSMQKWVDLADEYDNLVAKD